MRVRVNGQAVERYAVQDVISDSLVHGRCNVCRHDGHFHRVTLSDDAQFLPDTTDVFGSKLTEALLVWVHLVVEPVHLFH